MSFCDIKITKVNLHETSIKVNLHMGTISVNKLVRFDHH